MAKTKFEVYKDRSSAYRWRLISSNGESVAVGGEAYASKNGAMNAAKKLKDWSKTKDIVDVEKEAELAKKAAEKEKAAAKKAKESAKKGVKKSATKKSKAKPAAKAKKEAKKVTKAKPAKKAVNKTKKAKATSEKVDKMPEIHIVKKEDKYDNITVSEAMEKGLGEQSLM